MAPAELYVGSSDLGATTKTARSPGRVAHLQLAPGGVRVVKQLTVPDTGLAGLAVGTWNAIGSFPSNSDELAEVMLFAQSIFPHDVGDVTNSTTKLWVA